ncbi:hypothetical protein [Arhodomonas sp. AD133]|uniref:hypothetical protein n=1 Tax=Arhodomonas sp. AD133 TaxID=3415009 RepID=UPI003EC0001F
MTNMRPIALAVVLLPLAASADTGLDSAFGIAFGEAYAPPETATDKALPDGGHLYRLDNPPRPYPVLDDYRVRTGSDGRVAEIVATASLASAEACAREQDVIADAVANKYEEVARVTTGDELLRRTALRIGPDRVEVVCVDDALELRYLSASAGAADSTEAVGAQDERNAEDGPPARDTSPL